MSGGVKFLPIRSYAMLRLPGGAHHRIGIMVIGTAAAEIAGHRQADLIARRFGVYLEERDGRHDLAGRAEAALGRELLNERLLHRVQFAIGAFQPLDGRDLAATQRMGQRRAGVVRDVVDQHRAGAAFTAIAAELGAGEAELVAQRHRQRLVRRHIDTARLAVDIDRQKSFRRRRVLRARGAAAHRIGERRYGRAGSDYAFDEVAAVGAQVARLRRWRHPNGVLRSQRLVVYVRIENAGIRRDIAVHGPSLAYGPSVARAPT